MCPAVDVAPGGIRNESIMPKAAAYRRLIKCRILGIITTRKAF
jgi:hypothetical protein